MEFNFTVDRKVIGWVRDEVSIIAESQEEAIKKAINEDYDDLISSDFLFETIEPLGDIEIFDEHMNSIYDSRSI